MVSKPEVLCSENRIFAGMATQACCVNEMRIIRLRSE